MLTIRPAFRPWLLLAGLCIMLGLGASAQAASRDLAVLVVGRSGDPAMAAQERQVIDKLNHGRNARGWSPRTLPIYSYHFDKEGERAYCEQRLKIKASDLVVVGLVELESGVPVSFVYRESSVRNAEKCADNIMERAKAELASRGATPRASSTPRPVAATSPRPATTPKAPVTPAASTTPRPVASTTPRPVASTTPRPAVTPKAPVTPVGTPTVRPIVTVTPTVRPVASSTPATSPSPAATTPRPVASSSPVAVQTTPASPTVVAPPNPNDRWALQVGLVSTLEKAHLLARKMKEDGHKPVTIRRGSKDGKVVFRVFIGFFTTQAEAYAKAKETKEAGLDCFSVKIDPALGEVVP